MTAIPPSFGIDPAEPALDLRGRRPDVVRRLLGEGVSAETLRALLPGWEAVIEAESAQPVRSAKTGSPT